MSPRSLYSTASPGTEQDRWAYHFLDPPLKPSCRSSQHQLSSSLLGHHPISTASQSLWKVALLWCQTALSTLSRYCQGPLICRAQAPLTVHTSILPSLTVGLCSHQPGLLFPRPGAQQCWRDRGEESAENLGLFSAGLSVPWSCFNPPESLSAPPQESLALEPFCNSIHHSATGCTMSTVCPAESSVRSSTVKQLKYPSLFLLINLMTTFHETELFCFTKS